MSETADSETESTAYDRIFYPFLFAGGTSSLDDILAQVRHSILEKCHEIVELRLSTIANAGQQLVAAAEAMARAFRNGATLLALGNGGSATDAQDLVTELIVPPFPHWPPLPAIALTNDSAVITAIGNDVGSENVFTRQIIALGRTGDIALAISTSGNSLNILAALEQAQKQGLLTVALTGYDGGNIQRSPATNFCINVANDHIPRIQEAQATIYHTLIELVHSCLQRGECS